MGGARGAQPPQAGPPLPSYPPIHTDPPHLVPPSVEVHASFLAALDEYHAEGRHTELPAGRLADPAEFARYVAALRADVETPGAAVRYVAALTGSRRRRGPTATSRRARSGGSPAASSSAGSPCVTG